MIEVCSLFDEDFLAVFHALLERLLELAHVLLERSFLLLVCRLRFAQLDAQLDELVDTRLFELARTCRAVAVVCATGADV